MDTLISPPSSFGVSTGENSYRGTARFKVPSAFPGLSAASFAASAHLRPPRGSLTAGQVSEECHHVKELSFGSGKRRSRTCNCRFSLVNPIRGRGSLAPRHCPLPGTVVMVWFDFRRGLFAYRFNQGAYCGHLSAYAGVGRSLFLAQLAVMLPHVFRAFQVIFKSLVAFHSLFHRVLH